MFFCEELTVNVVAEKYPQEWCGTSCMTVTASLGGSRLCRVSEEMRGFPAAIQYSLQSSQSTPLFSPLPCVSVPVCVCICWSVLTCLQSAHHLLPAAPHLPLIHHQLQSKTPAFHPFCCGLLLDICGSYSAKCWPSFILCGRTVSILVIDCKFNQLVLTHYQVLLPVKWKHCCPPSKAFSASFCSSSNSDSTAITTASTLCRSGEARSHFLFSSSGCVPNHIAFCLY